MDKETLGTNGTPETADGESVDLGLAGQKPNVGAPVRKEDRPVDFGRHPYFWGPDTFDS